MVPPTQDITRRVRWCDFNLKNPIALLYLRKRLLEISRGAPSICSMKNKKDQPKNERERTGRQRDEHEPPHHAQSIKQLAVIFSIDHARMHRAFIDAAAVCVSD